MMKLAVIDGASASIGAIAAKLAGLSRSLNVVQQGMNTAFVSGGVAAEGFSAKLATVGKTMIAVGAVSATVGASMLLGLNKLANAGEKLNEQMAALKRMGFDEDTVRAAQAIADAAVKAVPGTTPSGNLAAFRNLVGRLGGGPEGFTAAGPIFETLLMQGKALEAAGSGDFGTLMGLVSALGPRGLTALNQPGGAELLTNFTEGVVRAIQQNPNINTGMFGKFLQMAGVPGLRMSPEFIASTLPTLLADYSQGGRINPGMMLMRTMDKIQQIFTAEGKKGEQQRALWQNLGLSRPTAEMMRDPRLLAQMMREGFQAKGFNQEQMGQAVERLFGGRAGNVLADMIMNPERFGRAGAAAPGSEAYPGMTLEGKPLRDRIAADFQTIAEKIGQPITQLKEQLLRDLLPVLERFRDYIMSLTPEQIQNIARAIGIFATTLVALGGTAIIGGLLALAGPAGGLVLLGGALATLFALDWKNNVEWMKNIGNTIKEIIGMIGDKLSAFLDMLKHFASFIPGVSVAGPGKPAVGPLPPAAGTVPGIGYVPGMAMAEGGIVSSPTLALLGERGPEAVIPLGGADGLRSSASSRPIQVFASLNVDGRLLAQAISDQLSELYEFPTSAPSANGWASYHSPDYNIAAT